MQDVSQLNTLILVMMNCTLLVLILCLSTGWTVVRLYVSGRDRQIIAGEILYVENESKEEIQKRGENRKNTVGV